MSRPLIRLAMFDMAGTTVNDLVGGDPLVVGAIKRAFARHGYTPSEHAIHAQRGQEKRQMVALLLQEVGGPPSQVDAVYADFLQALEQGVAQVSEMEGVGELFRWLQARSVRIGVGSGFPTDITERILQQLGWREQGLVDYAASAEQVGAGRPDPAMIRDAMNKLGVSDPRQVLKIGDTVMDVREGKNAGAWTVAVLSGTQTREQLAGAGPDYILPGISALPALLFRQGPAALRRPTLEDAIAWAVEAHQGQMEKGDQPYILHPMKVMSQQPSEAARIVAALHDVFEDTDHRLEELRYVGYAEAIIEALDALTRREGESYEAFIERLAPNALARRVKLADLEDNMDVRRLPEITERDVERLRRYQQAWLRLQRED